MNPQLRTVLSDLGRVLQAMSLMMFLSILVPLVWGEYYAIPGLLISGLLPLGVGRLFTTVAGDAKEPSKLHGMMIAASAWLLAALFGAVPFFLIAWTVHLDPVWLTVPASVDTPTLAVFRNLLNGYFESMSGFTGTGLTMADDESVLPHTLQWWRSFIQWIGGVGVIVLTTAILAGREAGRSPSTRARPVRRKYTRVSSRQCGRSGGSSFSSRSSRSPCSGSLGCRCGGRSTTR